MLTRIKNYTFNLGAIAITLGATAIAAAPSIAQTTSVPITGGNFSVNLTSTGAVTNPTGTGITVLTPVGTAQITSLTGTTATTTPLSANGSFDIQGTKTNGSVNFDDGRTATFTDAKSTIKGKITEVNGVVPVNQSPVSALAAPATVKGSIQTGSSIQVPTSSISALPANTVVIPITGGKFEVVRFNSGTITGEAPTVLTPYGTARLTQFKYLSLDSLNNTMSEFFKDDEVRVTGEATGSIPQQVGNFTSAKTAFVGKLTDAKLNSNASYSLKGDITSGNLNVPTSSTTNLPNVSNETTLIVLNNRQLFKLIGLNSRFFSSSKSKFLLVLVNNQSLLNYVESKSSEVESSDFVTVGTSNAVDKVVFVNFQKKNIYSFSEVSFRTLVTRLNEVVITNNTSTNISNNTSTNTSNNTSTNTSNNTSTNTSTNTSNNTSTNTSTTSVNQSVKVVVVGLPSRLFPGFGRVVKFERFNKGGDDDD